MEFGLHIKHWASRVLGTESIDPVAAAKSVTESVADALEESASDFLRVAGAVERCAAIAAAALVSTAPELDEARIRDQFSRELWMAVTELSTFARAGFLS